MNWRVAAAYLFFLVPAHASAQELKPLKQAIIDGGEETYPLVRCAGLFLSVLERAGEERLGKETAEKTEQFVENVMSLAITMREPALGKFAQDSVVKDVQTITIAYMERYSRNYALVGEAFGQDAMWSADRDLCVQLFGS